MRSLLFLVFAVLLTATPVQAATAARVAQSYGQDAKPRPTLEQLAYRYWGKRLERACPGGSLRFTVSRVSPRPDPSMADAAGGSWGDCHPWVNSTDARRPELCSTALHEAGHEVGLLDRPGHGGLMDNTRTIIFQRAVIYDRHGHGHRARSWSGIPALCQPGVR